MRTMLWLYITVVELGLDNLEILRLLSDLESDAFNYIVSQQTLPPL
jgi:hypothetical protein